MSMYKFYCFCVIILGVFVSVTAWHDLVKESFHLSWNYFWLILGVFTVQSKIEYLRRKDECKCDKNCE